MSSYTLLGDPRQYDTAYEHPHEQRHIVTTRTIITDE